MASSISVTAPIHFIPDLRIHKIHWNTSHKWITVKTKFTRKYLKPRDQCELKYDKFELGADMLNENIVFSHGRTGKIYNGDNNSYVKLISTSSESCPIKRYPVACVLTCLQLHRLSLSTCQNLFVIIINYW